MGSKRKEKQINCQPLTLNRQAGDWNVWQFDCPACLLYLYCLKGSVLMGRKIKEKKTNALSTAHSEYTIWGSERVTTLLSCLSILFINTV